MKNKYFYIFLIIGLILTQSCSKTKPSLEKQLARFWQYDNENGNEEIDSSSYFHFKIEKVDGIEVRKFESFTNGRRDIGTWNVIDSNNLVLSLPMQGSSSSIDSTSQTFDDNGVVSVHFYNNDELVSSFVDGKFFPKQFTKKFKIHELNGDHLYLWQNNPKGSIKPFTIFTYKYESKVLPTSISFKSVTRGLIGIFALIFITFLFSSNRKKINWSLVAKGLGLQLILAIAVLYVPFVTSFFDALSEGFIRLIKFTEDGNDFVFGSFATGKIENGLINFAFKILPTIIFFSALMSMLYYLGILQKIVFAFAWVMKKFMKLSGAESLAAAGNIFLGQTEAPFLVKPYLEKMTKSELMCLMTGGMATIAGGVLAAYIGFLGGDDPEQSAIFAKHLLTASIMSAPAAVVAAKILVPEIEDFNTEMKIPREKIGTNILEAITNGSTDGLKLAVNVGVMLLVFTAIIFMANFGLEKIGDWTGLNEVISKNTNYNELSFQFILGYSFAPIAGLMGVDSWNDMVLTGQLLGEKTILNEFFAYKTFGDIKPQFESQKAVIMSTYMLCGFANFASIGIQIGGIGALIPSRKGLLSKLGVKALIGGTVASLLTAVVVGMFL